MANRKLPEPEKYASCPSDGNILQYYEGTFDTVFIAFHQFFRRNQISLKEFEGNNWPSNPEIREKCSEIHWSEILSVSGIATVAKLDVGLRTSIGGLNKHFEDRDASNTIALLDNGIMVPNEGFICPFVEARVLSALLESGEKWLWIGDEFCTERKIHWIEDLLNQEVIPYSACCYTPDKNVLITTHWDSHCTFICGNRGKIEKLIDTAGLEGFYCDKHTEVYWGLTEEK